MSKYDRYIGFILFSFGFIICVQSFRYPFGSLRLPGAGLFPLVASTFLMAIAIAIVIRTYWKKGEDHSPKEKFFPTREAPQRILLAFISLGAFRYLLPVMGLAPTTFLFIFFLGKYLADYDFKTSASLAAAAALLSYFIFQYLLKTPFPEGILGF